MKRSEMINLIYNHIDGYMDPTASYNVAVKLLEKIEKAGMLPPARHLKLQNLDGSKNGEQFLCSWDYESEDLPTGTNEDYKNFNICCGGGCHEN